MPGWRVTPNDPADEEARVRAELLQSWLNRHGGFRPAPQEVADALNDLVTNSVTMSNDELQARWEKLVAAPRIAGER
jgi:hypothetical protein